MPTCASCTPARWQPRSACRSAISCRSPSAVRGRPAVQVAPKRTRGPMENAEFAALVLLVQDWDSIAPWLIEPLFDDDANRMAFVALAEAHGDLQQALETAAPDAREVLERAAVADLNLVPEVEARTLIGASVRRELKVRSRSDRHRLDRGGPCGPPRSGRLERHRSGPWSCCRGCVARLAGSTITGTRQWGLIQIPPRASESSGVPVRGGRPRGVGRIASGEGAPRALSMPRMSHTFFATSS